MSASVFSTLAEVAERWTPDTPFPYLESSFLRRRDHHGVLPIIDVSSILFFVTLLELMFFHSKLSCAGIHSLLFSVFLFVRAFETTDFQFFWTIMYLHFIHIRPITVPMVILSLSPVNLCLKIQPLGPTSISGDIFFKTLYLLFDTFHGVLA